MTKPVAYVRSDFLPERAPPASGTGLIGWMRENLFSSIGNSLLTLAGLYSVYLLLAAVVPWVLNGIWDAESIRDCRDQLAGVRGGCFAVIAERWPQLVFGNYNADQYWRPVLAIFLMLFALAPLLFSGAPRALLWFTGLFPFLAYWLIWGGSIWVPVLALAGIIAGYATFKALDTKSFVGGIVAALAVVLFSWIVIVPTVADLLSGILPIELVKVESRNIGGFLTNFILGATSITLSLPLGIALALGRQSNLPIIKSICVVFIEFIRGVPLITLLFVASVMLAYFLPPGTNFDLYLRVIIMITLFASAYIAEAVRGGLAALPKGQYEAADSMGLDYWQAMRLVILPQALKIAIPGIVNIFIGLFKDTTLVSIISIFDVLGMIGGPILSSTEWFGVYWELYAFAALMFFPVCYGISQYSQYLERKLATDHR